MSSQSLIEILSKMFQENLKPRGKVNFEDFYRICTNAVKTVGINLMPNEEWALTHTDLLNKFWRRYHKFWFYNGIWLIISYVLTFYSFLGDWFSVEFLKSIIAFLTGICNLYKGFLMNRHQDEIKEIMLEIKKYFPVHENDQEKFGIQEDLKKLLRLKKIYLTLYTSLLFGIFIPQLLYFILKGEQSLGNWTPFEVDALTPYLINYFWLVWIAFTFCLCGFGADFILYSTITMICIQFKVIEILNFIISFHSFFSKQILKEDVTKSINNNLNLSEIISRQNKISNQANKLQNIFGIYLLIFIVSSSATISVICIQLASTKDFPMFVPFLLTTLNQVYLLCYYGQKLYDSSSLIYEGISNSNFYEIKDLKTMKIIPFLIQKSQDLKILRAHRFSVIKLSTFMGVSSYKLKNCNILRN